MSDFYKQKTYCHIVNYILYSLFYTHHYLKEIYLNYLKLINFEDDIRIASDCALRRAQN